MADYIKLTRLLLPECGKYLLVLLVVVLAIRLWRRWRIVPAGQRRNDLLAALAATMVAAGIGYVSMCHSLGRLYTYYGTRAMEAGNLASALSLFEQSAGYWTSAEAVGKRGVCLLLSGKTDQGLEALDQARALRHGKNSPFEEFYAGLCYFFRNQPDQAGPLLEGALGDTQFQWPATKLLAALAFMGNRPQEAERLLSRFAQIEVPDTEPDHAYVMASLKLFEGKPQEAKALLNRFPGEKLSAFWKPRFEQLRAKTLS